MEKETKANNKSVLKNAKLIWPYFKKAKLPLFIYGLVAIMEAVISAVLPIVEAKIILGITNAIINQLLLAAIGVFALEILLSICNYLKTLQYAKIYREVSVKLQTEIAKETLKLEVKELDKNSSGLFIDRVNKDTDDISGIFMDYTYYISYIITNVGVMVAILLLNKYMFIYDVIVAVMIYIINKKRLATEIKFEKSIKSLHEKKTSIVGELIRGIRDIKVLNATNNALEKTSEKIIDTSKEEIKLIKYRNKYRIIEKIANASTEVIFLLLGCYLYKEALITIPAFLTIYYYQNRVHYLLTGVVHIQEYNNQFLVSSNRIFEILKENKYSKEVFGNTHIKKLEGNIKFNKVNFSYDDSKKILNNISFEIKPNQKVGFVGESGVGKTTLFSLITKLYTINSGEITIDNYNINDLDNSSLRDNMSIITQDPYIFNFSIKDNLLLAKKDATMKEIREACKAACIDDYIMSLPDKYNTIVGENGVILSGGQKQRLAIARALLLKTEIILFDEATSALDNETQSKIQQAIDNLKGEYTILIVAHRLSTVIDCDKIFVMDDGKIIDSGTHKELYKRCSLYKKLYEKDLKR